MCAEVLKVWWKLCVAGCRMLPVSTSPAAPTHHMLLIVIIFVIVIVIVVVIVIVIIIITRITSRAIAANSCNDHQDDYRLELQIL